MSVHFDTNIVIGILNDTGGYSARYKSLRRAGETVFVSSVVAFELHFGMAWSRRVKDNTIGLRSFLETLDGVLPFEDGHAVAAANIRVALQKAGTPIGPYDLLIAGHAVREAAKLVTANAREFARVPGLKIEDWSK